MSTTWASGLNYASLSADLAKFIGQATKNAPADYANGFAPKGTFDVTELNYIFNEVQAQIVASSSAQVPSTRTLTAGNGLAGGGTLAADRTFTFNPDGGSLSVSASGVKVGVIDATMHGNRGAGALHPDATTSVAGYASPTDKTNLNTLVAVSAAAAYSWIESTATGTQNDWAPTGWDNCRALYLTGSGSITITGFAAPSSTGQWVKAIRTATVNVTLSHEDAGSAAANRLRLSQADGDDGTADHAGWIIAYARGAATPRWYAVGTIQVVA